MNKICPRCQTPNLAEAMFCASCAAPLGPAPMPPNQQGGAGQQAFASAPSSSSPSGQAIISFVLAIVALILCCGPLTGVPAAIVGWMELGAIKAGRSSPAGRWMAQVGIWGGIVISILSILAVVGWLLLSLMAGAGGYYSAIG